MLFDTTNIPDSIVELWHKADELWETEQAKPDFESYASADYGEVYHALKSLVGKADTFLEFGSGLGIVTMMADYLGFQSHGIEAKEGLVDMAEEYARHYAPQAKFAAGSFIPEDFYWNPSSGDESVRTFVDVPSAYRELEMELADFDLIYAYPWPTEHDLYSNILNQNARKGAIYMSYDAREGINISIVE